jgi:zinc protease
MNGRAKLLFPLAVTLTLLPAPPAARAQATDWKKIVIPPLHEFHPVQPRRVELPNGMVLFLQEDHELPLIRGTARIRGGSREEPADKVGLVEIYGEVWRTGGTKSQTGDQLDDFLEARAAKVETSGRVDSTFVSLDCLKENFDEVFQVFVDLLREPEFREDKIGVARSQVNTSIARRNDDIFEIAGREANKLVYGANSPYARIPEYATVAAISRDDLLSWHRTYVHPNNIVLGMVGDFDSKMMEAKLRGAFDSWPRGPAAPKAESAFPGPKPGYYFVAKDDVTESAIRMVHLGTTRDNPDFFALEVLNQAFGGGFASRLFSNIRSKRGLAYYVFGGVGAAYDHPGIFEVAMGTKNGTTATSLDALYAELDAIQKNPPSADELKKAKDGLLNSFIFRFDSKEKVLRERMAYEFYGYPADFLERYRAGIEKVTQEDLARVAHRYVHKDRLAILVVGKAADFDRPLSSFGPVTNVDITIPTGTAAKAKAPVATNPEGKALLGKVIESLGGAAKVRTVKSLRTKLDMQMKTPMGEMAMTAEQVVVYPNQVWQKMTMPMGEILLVVSPTVAFIKGPMGTQDLPTSQKEDLLGEMMRDPLLVTQHADDPDYAFAAAGSEKVGEVEATILDVNAGGAEVRWFVDPQSGRILRASWQATGPAGPGERVVEYGDWKTVEGLTLPTKETRTLGGEKEGSVDIKEIEVNPATDPKLFEKPS